MRIDGAIKALKALSTRLSLRALFTSGVVTGFEHRKALKYSQCRTVIDIGANRGQFSLACRLYIPDCKVFAFEPLGSAAKIYETVFKDDDRVQLYRSAIGPTKGTALLHVTAKSDSSSLLAIGERQVKLFPSSVEVGKETVQISRLADILSPKQLAGPTMLKLDVQGYELQVLEGCKDLFSDIDFIYVECSFVELYAGQSLASEVVSRLYELSFQIIGVYNSYYDQDGSAIQADMLFERKRD